MKKAILSTLALMLCLSSAYAKDYKYQTVEGDPMQTRIYTLDNGLKVYLSVNPEKPRIQTYITVRTGSKNDPAETTGLAHYLEHLMFKGTSRFGTSNAEAEAPLLADIERRYEEYRLITDPELRRQKYHEIDSVSQLAAQYFIPNEYDKLMAAIGAQGTNAFTSNDVTCYTEDIPSNEIENWAKIQSDRFQNMVIRGFHTELEAVYEEYNIGLANDNNKVFEALMAKLFPTHPYGTQTTIGTQQHLNCHLHGRRLRPGQGDGYHQAILWRMEGFQRFLGRRGERPRSAAHFPGTRTVDGTRRHNRHWPRG